MIRSFPYRNNFRTTWQPADDRGHPLEFQETPISVHQGAAKGAQLGEVVYPFRELHVSDYSGITQIRYKQGSSSWNVVSLGSYSNLIQATRAISFTPEAFGIYEFTLEITVGSFLLTRTVDVLVQVNAGRDKLAALNATIKPFFDAAFSIESSLVSSVEYSIDGGAVTPIPSTFGADLVDRVKNFSTSWAAAGEKKISLVITDTEANESRDALSVRVSS